MNDDRISEVYKGEIWSDDAQNRARRRVNWMVSRARGTHVLDVGCSQGIASILLGREGFDVVGVDIQADRIEYAIGDLENESESTKARVAFRVMEGSSLDFPDGAFDTVLLGEVIEHLAVPRKVLTETRRVLRDDGVVVVTTPFGLLHHHDHKQTFFPTDLVALLESDFAILEAEVVDGYFRIVASPTGESSPEVLNHLTQSAERAMQDVQQSLHDSRRSALALERQTKTLQNELAKVERSNEKLQVAWRETKGELGSLKGELKDARVTIERLRAEVSAHGVELTNKSAELEKVSANRDQLAARNDRLKARLIRRQREIEAARHQAAVNDWKLRSLKRRRWWRLGAELASVRRRPMTVLTLPFRLGRVLQPLPKLDRPTLDEVRGSRPGAIDVSDIRAVIPARAVPALALCTDELAAELSWEVQVFRLDLDDWSRQVESIAPHVLIVEETDAISDRTHDVREMVAGARASGALTVLWARSGSTPLLDVEFDVKTVPHGVDRAGEDVVQRRGLVQHRAINPVGSYRKPHDAGIVSFSALELGEERYGSLAALADAAKRYRVVVAEDVPTLRDAASVIATGAVLVVPGENPSYGLAAATEEERDVLLKALLRSEVLGERLVHPQRRELFRQRTVARDLDRILGQEPHLPRIDVMVATKRPEKLGNLLENLGRQTYPNLGLTLVAHGLDVDHGEVKEAAARHGVTVDTILEVPEEVILGEVFNRGFDATAASLVAKMDDDDYYGAEYLWDLYNALEFSGAEVAGKWAHYVYIEGIDSVIFRFPKFEYRYTDVVAISTLLMRRDVLSVERFPSMPWGSGSVFLRALGSHGARVFAGDRWNYLYVRGTDGEGNTFPISDRRMLLNGSVVCKGMNLAEVSV